MDRFEIIVKVEVFFKQKKVIAELGWLVIFRKLFLPY